MFKVNNKDTRTTPYFTPSSSVSNVNFELANVGWLVVNFAQKNPEALSRTLETCKIDSLVTVSNG